MLIDLEHLQLAAGTVASNSVVAGILRNVRSFWLLDQQR